MPARSSEFRERCEVLLLPNSASRGLRRAASWADLQEKANGRMPVLLGERSEVGMDPDPTILDALAAIHVYGAQRSTHASAAWLDGTHVELDFDTLEVLHKSGLVSYAPGRFNTLRVRVSADGAVLLREHGGPHVDHHQVWKAAAEHDRRDGKRHRLKR
ncbi:hypothetical protein [Halopolyspora algeriensis]|nr:hypothetical protein [Halopolyspora algeriensis]